MNKVRLLTAVLLFGLAHNTNAQQELSAKDRLAWWHEAKFGLFINWGIHSLYGGVYKGHQQARGGAEWIMNRCKIPVAEYREMAKQFNPTKYDPEAWVKMARDAGMKYLVISVKHHDGFALFDSKESDWNVVKATPYGKDLLKPLAEACKKYGIKLGIYYSQAVDWTNPGGAAARRLMKEGWPNPDSTKIDQYTLEHDGHWDPVQMTATFDEYIDRVAVPQVRELLTNYGRIDILWWDYATQMKTVSGAEKLKSLLTLQPGIITNDRLHPDFHGDTKTPEQAIPERNEVEGQNWETCMTMNSSWGYKSWDKNWKSPEMLIRNLIRIAARGGNYLLNVGPKPDGTFPEECIDRLKAIGDWMKVNGEAIYGTRAGQLPVLSWGECTQKEQNGKTILYLSVFDWPKNGQLTIPGLKKQVVSARLLATGAKLKTSVTGKGVEISTPEASPDPVASVIRLELKGRLAGEAEKNKKKMQSGAID
jgi:alpha-L-fucosidase